MAEIVAADRISRSFGSGDRRVEAVKEASFQVLDGELVMLLGRSGAGKTTLLSCCGGLDRPDSGSVQVAGQRVEGLHGSDLQHFLANTVGWVFQSAGLLPLLTAEENVALGLRLAGTGEREAMATARQALSSVGLSERAAHRGHELSGGEQQRVALARALAKGPALLIADEPTAQLDTETAAGILALIQEAAQSGIAVLMATHDEAATELADRVLLLDDGVLKEPESSSVAKERG